MPKILFTASTFGHLRHFHQPYMKAFKERGWGVLAAAGGETAELPWADRLIRVPIEKKMSSPANFRASAVLRREIRAEGIDLISTHTSLAAFFTRLAVKGLKDRPLLVNTVHGYLFDDESPAAKKALLLAAERLTVPETDLLLTMNAWDYELAARQALGRRVAAIPGIGADFDRVRPEPERGKQLRAELGLPAEAFALLYPAEFSPRKSQETLLRALSKLPERAVLVLPGQGAELERCRSLAAELGLERRVFFPGQQSAMGPWYALADAAVSSSRSEGLPFNILEAMACGLPIAASAVKGNEDLIRDGETGLLFPYGDAEACAAAVGRLLESEPLRRELGQRARAAAENYRLERVLPQVLAEYDRLLEENGLQ